MTLVPYDGTRLSRVRYFATSPETQILILTIDAFNRATNNIYKPSERLPGERLPYQYIQETRPIVILDEPQSIDGTERARSAIRTLHPLFGLRYSATHRRSPNLVYRLTPVQAYRENLVKKIQVIGLSSPGAVNESYLALESISKAPLTANIKTLIQEHGTTRDALLLLKHGDNLFKKTRREEHKDGYVVEEINAYDNFVLFTNGMRLCLGDSVAPSRPQIFQAQIFETVRQHMEMQERVGSLGIKVLSLFFIDRVANYTSEQGIIRKLFDSAFLALKVQYPHFHRYEAKDVREAYFAKTQPKKGSEEIAVDTAGRTAGEREAERRAFELIMRNKEDLLLFTQPVSFIFAHSALNEGWDNPNVFQICTLNQTVSEIKKRQEIGRGLRLAVNQHGDRVSLDDVNVLTVVANESYQTYVASLQREYVEDGNEAPLPPRRPQDGKAHRRNSIYRGQDFQDLWIKLNRKTRYQIQVDTDVLIEECTERLAKVDFPQPVVVLTRGRFVVTEFSIRLGTAIPGHATVALEISDTDGVRDKTQIPVSPRVDLAKVKNDDRLRGFKVQEISGNNDRAVVKFANGEELTPFKSIFFRTERGQHSDERPSEVLAIENICNVFDVIGRAAKETYLTRPTLNRIFQRLPVAAKSSLFKNPEGFAALFIGEIKNAVADHVSNRIQFVLDGENQEYDGEEIFPEVKSFVQKELTDSGTRGLYDKVQWDSEVELRFVEKRLKTSDDRVICYFKFPPLFKITLPKIIGSYNPDWGIVCYDDTGKLKLHLVRETKGSLKLGALQFPAEGRKIICAGKHFAKLGINYRHITDEVRRWWSDAGSPDPTKLF